MTKSLKRDLEITLETALMLDAKTPIPALAKKIYDAEPELVESVKEEFIIDRFTWMLYRKHRKAKAVARISQMTLPGFEGLEKLPLRITLKNGTRPELRDATLQQLKEFRFVLWSRRDSRIPTLDKLIALVAGYSKPGAGSKITVGKVIDAEKAKQLPDHGC
jgi:hypothetical protein